MAHSRKLFTDGKLISAPQPNITAIHPCNQIDASVVTISNAHEAPAEYSLTQKKTGKPGFFLENLYRLFSAPPISRFSRTFRQHLFTNTNI